MINKEDRDKILFEARQSCVHKTAVPVGQEEQSSWAWLRYDWLVNILNALTAEDECPEKMIGSCSVFAKPRQAKDIKGGTKPLTAEGE